MVVQRFQNSRTGREEEDIRILLHVELAVRVKRTGREEEDIRILLHVEWAVRVKQYLSSATRFIQKPVMPFYPMQMTFK